MPTTTKIAASSAERCATARPPSLRSICGICGAACWARAKGDGPASPASGAALPGFCLMSMPPMMRWTIGGQDERDDQGGQHEREDALPERHGEHVEGDVAAEDRVLLAPRRLVEVQEHALPGAGGRDGGDERDDDADDRRADADPPAHGRAARLQERAVDVGAEVRRQPPRQLHVGPDDDEEEDEGHEAEQQLRPDARPEDAAEADLAEPEPVHVHAEDAAAEGEDDDDDRDDDRRDDAPPGAAVAPGLGRLLLGAEGADVVHAQSMADSTRLVTTVATREPAAARAAGGRQLCTALSARSMAVKRWTIFGSSSCEARWRRSATLSPLCATGSQRRQTAKARATRGISAPRRPSG